MKRIGIKLSALLFIIIFMLSACSKKSTADTENLPNLGGNDDAFGESLSNSKIYDGYFEDDVVEITVICLSGSENCYNIDGNTLTFTSLSENSVYSISGKLKGNIIIDIGDDYKFDLEMQGLSLVSESTNPITILSGNEVSITAKKDYKNYIYDNREAVAKDDNNAYSSAIYSLVDLKICGNGELNIISENNNGIHTKKDLIVKNLSLFVLCNNNALKGNDSVTIESGKTILIAKDGDGIKTSNSNISSKGNQRGIITISGGTHTIYASYDGIDAEYNVVIDGKETVLDIYTYRYSNYSNMAYMPSDNNIVTVSYVASPYAPPQRPGGFGGGGGMGGFGGGGMMGGGNPNKATYSCKGIKASNEILINNGTITIKSYDDAIHAGSTTVLENEQTPLGNVTIDGGNIVLYSNDDGIHADGILTISNGAITVLNSYEGLEGRIVNISGGFISVKADDDGINGTATSETAITISGGTIYVYAGGDGVDANSTTSYKGIVFSGGNVVIISTSNGNSAIDTERGYQYIGGNIVAIMPSGGMSNEALNCSNFSSIGTNKTISLKADNYLIVKDGKNTVTILIPTSISARVIYLGSNSASFSSKSSSSALLDQNGVCWK